MRGARPTLTGFAPRLVTGVGSGEATPGETAMATYVLLMNWRAEGAAGTPLAALGHLGLSPSGGGGSVFETRKSIVESALSAVEGGKLCNLLWTLGETDMVAVVEAKDNEQIGGFSLYL